MNALVSPEDNQPTAPLIAWSRKSNKNFQAHSFTKQQTATYFNETTATRCAQTQNLLKRFNYKRNHSNAMTWHRTHNPALITNQRIACIPIGLFNIVEKKNTHYKYIVGIYIEEHLQWTKQLEALTSLSSIQVIETSQSIRIK